MHSCEPLCTTVYIAQYKGLGIAHATAVLTCCCVLYMYRNIIYVAVELMVLHEYISVHVHI